MNGPCYLKLSTQSQKGRSFDQVHQHSVEKIRSSPREDQLQQKNVVGVGKEKKEKSVKRKKQKVKKVKFDLEHIFALERICETALEF